MSDNLASLSSHAVIPSQTVSPPLAPVNKDDVVHKVEAVEEEPYTIKCICNFSDDDGNTIYCETCDTWQHIECFYPENRDEAIREDFAHSCADCQPRPLNREKAIERTQRLRNAALEEADKKTKRPPSKSHKRKPKPAEIKTQGSHGAAENGKHASPSEHAPLPKKAKTAHRPSQSISSQPSKRSPSYNQPRPHPAHPPSPATTPPDLPDDFQIHHYSDGFYSLYNEHEVPDTHNNVFTSLVTATALPRWLREPDTMKQETGRTHLEVFQEEPANIEETRPKLEVRDATRALEQGPTLRWRFVKSTAPIEKDVPLIELNGAIGFQKDYCADPDNLWADLSSPLPFVFFHPILPLYIDTRKEGSLARYVRRSCKPNAQLDTYLHGESEYHFWLVSDRYILANEQITLPWDFRLDKSVCPRWLHLLGLSEQDANNHDEPEMEDAEYRAISNWIDRILSEYGGCACDQDNNCAFARFHRQYLFSRNHGRTTNGKKKSRKPRTHTISPTSTGQATNSRAASEGHFDDHADTDGRDETGSSHSKPPSRDPTPLRQGSFDQLGILTEPTDRDKRKVAMVEDSFRRMEQQQPPRKKKRLSDGTTASTTSSTAKTKSRSSVSTSRGQYVDNGTSRSKSGSPSSVQSPNLSHAPRPSLQKQDTASTGSRPSSATPRPVYCDVGVQTDPVEGEWFSDPIPSPKPKKRIISLSKRLLNSRHKTKSCEQDHKNSAAAMPSPSSTSLECDGLVGDLPMVDSKQAVDFPSPVSQDRLADAPEGSVTSENEAPLASPTSKAPELRVQLPPVPAFDGSALAMHATTPLSTTSSIAQSPLYPNSPASPFLPTGSNGANMHPSPVKKKLSLSDYTKSRMNKSAGKVAGGTTILKAGLSSPEEIKHESIVESPTVEQAEDVLTPTTSAAPTMNGVARV
jgi:hypothetical protein